MIGGGGGEEEAGLFRETEEACEQKASLDGIRSPLASTAWDETAPAFRTQQKSPKTRLLGSSVLALQ